MHILFLSKVPVNNPPLGSPMGHLWRELPIYRDFFAYLSNSSKISLIKKVFPFSQ
jgi:hypothetical protein